MIAFDSCSFDSFSATALPAEFGRAGRGRVFGRGDCYKLRRARFEFRWALREHGVRLRWTLVERFGKGRSPLVHCIATDVRTGRQVRRAIEQSTLVRDPYGLARGAILALKRALRRR